MKANSNRHVRSKKRAYILLAITNYAHGDKVSIAYLRKVTGYKYFTRTMRLLVDQGVLTEHPWKNTYKYSINTENLLVKEEYYLELQEK